MRNHKMRDIWGAAAAGMLGAAAAAQAEDRYWNQPAGGMFNVAAHWLPAVVPGGSDTANFDLAEQGYAVGFDQDEVNFRLRVHQGHPIFNLGGHTYALDDAGQFSVIVGTDADPTAELTLADGTLQARRSIIGQSQESDGIVHVGPDTIWTNSAQLLVGRGGDGRLNITGGGRVTSAGVSVIGDFAGSFGQVRVSGAGSIWELQYLDVAFAGQGMLEVLDGGVVRVADARVAVFPNSIGEVAVSGAGSKWEMPGPLEWNEGTITISEGGMISAGSAWGGGTITIQDGAALKVQGQLSIHSTGTVHFRGGTLEADEASVTGSLLLDEGADKVVDLNTLSVDQTAGGRIDLADNQMLVRNGELSAIHELVKAGHAGGDWSGNGITSSTAAGDGQRALGVGPAEGGGVRVKFTWAGDVNLDGQVNISDLSILAGNWQQSNRLWHQGDFNYDGVVNISDLSILAANWQKGVGPVATAGFEEALALFDVFTGVAIPEPGCGMLVLIGAAGMLRRQQKTS